MCSGKGSLTTISGSSECFSSVIPRSLLRGASLETVSQFKIELEQEEDGRWIGEVPALPGVMTYGQTRAAVLAAVQALALRTTADRLENDEAVHEELLKWKRLPVPFQSPSRQFVTVSRR